MKLGSNANPDRNFQRFEQKEKLNHRDNAESKEKFLELFDWTNRLLTKTDKQAVEVILVEHHDISARYRKDIGMNTEFRVKWTPEDDKAV